MSRIIPDKSCLRILELWGARWDWVYRISPFWAEKINVYCDMSTQWGGWTLVLNYLHQWGTNPSLNILTNSLPLQNSTILWSDESGSVYWWHTSNQLLDSFDFEELKFYWITSNHDRVMHFSTTSCIDYFRTGTWNCSGISENFTPQKGHTSVFPTSGSSFFSNQWDLAMTNFPFFISGNYHWWIRGINNRWEVDDYSNNSSMDTHHQIYIR
jgi:hypothetical protein